MQSDYHINVRKISHRKRNRRFIIGLVVFALLIVGAGFYAHQLIHPRTKIKQSASITTSYGSSSTSSYQTYKASDFSFQMSHGWTVVPIKSTEYNLYEWQDGKGDTYQSVQIFEDTIPTNFAVNRVIIVAADQSKLSVIGAPSDNCATFTNGHTTNTQVGYPAKWQGASFNCDLDNTLRDTVGTTTTQSINTVSLVSPTNAHHSFFFLYSDSAIEPNYGDFEQLLNSFQLQ